MISPFGEALLSIGSVEIENITNLTQGKNYKKLSCLHVSNRIEVADLLHDVDQGKISLIHIQHTSFSVRFTRFIFPAEANLAIFTGAFDGRNKAKMENQCMLILALKSLINVLYFIPPDNLEAKRLRAKSKTSNIYYLPK